MRLRSAALAATLTFLLAATSPARAQTDDATRAAARTLAEAGLALQESGDHAGALAKFEKALALVQLPTLAVLSAGCLVKLGRLVEAAERYRQARAMTIDPSLAAGYKAGQLEAQAQAEAERAKLQKRIPVLEIALEGAAPADIELRIDDKVVPAATIGVDRPIDPGAHRIEARRGPDVATREATLREGERLRVVLTLPLRPAATAPAAPLAPAPASATADRPGGTQRTVGAVVTALGGASVVAGLVTWGLALGKKGDLDKACPNQICHDDAKATLDGYNTLRATTIATLVAGGVLAGAGIVTIAIAPSSAAPKAAITPWIAPNGAGVRGVF